MSHTFAVRIVNVLLKSNNTEFCDSHYHFELITQDPDDNKFVDCAIIAGAEYLVTDDRHFKVLNDIPFPKVNTVTLDQFQTLLML